MLKRGKEEIIYLLNKAIEKFRLETGKDIVLNTNRKNYEDLAILLSEISNQLPHTALLLGHDAYDTDKRLKPTHYPFRKYDITGGQIKDALMGLVANPRAFLVDACYIYLFGIGRKAFEENPLDESLIAKEGTMPFTDPIALLSENEALKNEIYELKKENAEKGHTEKAGRRQSFYGKTLAAVAVILALALIITLGLYLNNLAYWATLKEDFKLLPYKVTPTEIDSLEGIWLCYTGSPQARLSDSKRYHKIVSNLVEIKYKNGYFTYKRFGASFNHTGYAQFESPNLVSIHSRVVNAGQNVESPRHSLMTLDRNPPQNGFINAISASWNFDFGEKNRIVGIRESYLKIGKGGSIEEVINTLENASCQCKIIKWRLPDNTTRNIYLKNSSLDSLKIPALIPLINDSSILLKDPQEGLILHNN